MSWFRSKPKSKHAHGVKPRLETLEGRACPTVGIGIHGHTMFIRGDANANAITITDDGKGGISATIDGQSASGTGITRILVAAGAGDDTLTYSLAGPLSGNESLLVDLGKGNDTATLDYSQGVNSGRLFVGVAGAQGNDAVTVTSGAVAAGATAAFDLDGNSGDDAINFTSNGLLNGSLNFEAEGGKGNDTVVANVTIDAASAGKFKGEVEGGKGNDNLTFNVIDNTDVNGAGASGLAKFKATISGGRGTNTLTNTANVKVVKHEGCD